MSIIQNYAQISLIECLSCIGNGLYPMKGDVLAEDFLKFIGDALGAELVIATLMNNNEGAIELQTWKREYNKEDKDISADFQMQKAAYFRKMMIKIGFIKINDFNELPLEAEYERSYLEKSNCKALLAVPIQSSDNDFLGTLSALIIDRPRIWDQKDVQILRLIANCISQNIKVLKNIKELRQKERLYQDIFDNMRELLFFTDIKGNILHSNFSEYKGQNIFDIIDHSDRKKILRYYNDIVKHSIKNKRTSFSITDGKNCKNYEAHIKDLNDGPLVNGILINAKDVTRAKVLEKKFHAYVESAGSFIAVINKKGKVTLANKKFYEVFNLSKKDIDRLNYLSFYPINLKETARKNFNNLISGAIDWLEMERPLLTPQGETKHVSFNVVPFYDEKNKVNLIVSGVDRNQLVKAERKIIDREKMLSEFISSASEAILILDNEKRLLDYNLNLVNYFPHFYMREEVIGKEFCELIPSYVNKENIIPLFKQLETETKVRKKIKIDHPDYGELFFNVNIFRTGEGFGMIINDSTKQCKLQLEREHILNELKNKQIELNKINERYFYDIKGNIATLNAYIDLLKNEITDKKHIEDTERIKKKATEISKYLDEYKENICNSCNI